MELNPNEFYLQCEVCRTVLAMINRDLIAEPIHNSMFLPITPQYRIPFRKWVPWVETFCPACGKRPCLGTDNLMTDKGRKTIEELKRVTETEASEAEAVVNPTESGDISEDKSATCPTCGKVCKSAFGLQAHMRVHK